MKEELALQSLFTRLVEQGVPLGVRDYKDALAALREGFGFGGRARLLWLCQALWARTDEEARLITLAFRDMPPPTPEENARAAELAGETKKSLDKPKDSKGADAPPPERQGEAARRDGAPVPMPQFASPTQPGVGLPRARAEAAGDEPFILTPSPVIPLRSLVIIWRRFRAAMRTGPKVELDIDATIAAQSRAGLLLEPVLVAARRNQARLTVLLDASNSMLPWREFGRTLVESLRRGQLGRSAVYYFHNAPLDTLYEGESLSGPVKLEDALKQHESSTLLVVSDAGAARGVYNAERVAETRDFLSKVAGRWQPAVWMNPMPRARWKGTTAEAVGRLSGLTMFELTEEKLVLAVDVLRGLRRG